MPIRTSIDEASGLVTMSIERVVSYPEVLHAVDALLNHPDFDPGMDAIAVVAVGATSGLSSVQISALVARLRTMGDKRGTGRSAVVAPADADFGLIRVLSYLLRGSPRVIEVFKGRQTALRWLDR